MNEVEIIKASTSIIDRGKSKKLDKRLRVAAYCRVSTNDEDQLNSYRSQVKYYTELINSKKEWTFAGVYADEAITGTQVVKREEFQRLISACLNGEVDMVITKSISRFARNTLDTLKYVRMLKEKNVAVTFEEENINTLTMDGELLLVILSSVAQQEVENISANVKKGLKMKMRRGELVGFQGCLGYDYDKATKTMSINEEEAEIVRYIFNRYIEGAGGNVIGNELRSLGYKTKYGGSTWSNSTVLGIVRNEKYKGDLLLGKTFTVDPISKRRLENFGEEDQFYIRNHHEPIISEEVFDKAQEILARRTQVRKVGVLGKREKFTRKYSFSCITKCGFCGGALTRRNWHSGTTHSKIVWQCATATQGGKKYCPDSKGIEEKQIEQAFLESFRLLNADNKEILNEFLERVERSLTDSTVENQMDKIKKELRVLQSQKSNLIDMRLQNLIAEADYQLKYGEISAKIKEKENRLSELAAAQDTRKNVEKRIADFRKIIENGIVCDTFDRAVFESLVEQVIIGGVDENGNKDPEMITFIYKNGFTDKRDGGHLRTPRRGRRAFDVEPDEIAYPLPQSGPFNPYFLNNSDACRDVGCIIPQKARFAYRSKN